MRPSIWGQSLPRGSCDSRERSGQLLNALIPILHQVGFTARFRRRSAGELLPRLSILTRKRAVSFCCTFPGVASAGCYPALCRMVLGLSSPALAGAVAFLTQINIQFSKTIERLFLEILSSSIPNKSQLSRSSYTGFFRSFRIPRFRRSLRSS